MMLWYSLIIAVSLILCIYLFKKSAGTLHIGKLNIISTCFYLFILQVFAGTALIMLGLDRHYTLRYLSNRESSINSMFFIVIATSLAWPACMMLFLKLFRVRPKS